MSNIKCQIFSRRGLTLVEVLVAMGIVSVTGVLLLVIIVNSAGLFTQQSSKVQGGLNINDALAAVRGSIKQASSIADSYVDGSNVYTTSPTQLVLKVSSTDPSGNLVDSTYDFFVIFSDQKTLRLKVFPDPLSSRQPVDRIFSTSVDSLNFQYFNSENPPVEVPPADATKIRITLTLQQGNGVNAKTDTAYSEANLRND